MVYLSDSGGVFDYAADEEPAVGEVIALKPGDIQARIESVTEGEKGKMFSAVREQLHAAPDRPDESIG